MTDIKVYINKQEAPLVSAINIADTDEVQIEITSNEVGFFYLKDVDILLEDYKIPYTTSDDGIAVKSQTTNLFRESFGYNNLRLFVDGEPIGELVFNVSTNENKFQHIKGMMTYLLENNDRMLDLCFSRTKNKLKNDGLETASFDSVISLAEKIVYSFVEKGAGLKNQLRHRLELVKEDASGSNFYNINPYDVIDNIDKLHQGYSPDSVNLLGKVYSMEGIQRENHINSFNLEENKVLVGGLMSIKEVLLGILDDIDVAVEPEVAANNESYRAARNFGSTTGFVIEDLYTQLTTIGMEKRINSVLDPVNELLYFFEKEVKVVFDGYHPPLLSPFARKSSFYLATYRDLGEWYSLGSPDVGVDHDLTKIRSTSKIYELFSLYRVIDTLHKDGWIVDAAIEHAFFKNFIPSQVGFRKDDCYLSIFYEKKVAGFSVDTKHNDLVALDKNNSRNQYNYYNPDFIIMKTSPNGVSYFVLDAKYSSSYTLQKYSVLDGLYDKYFSNLAVYNENDNTLQKQAIKSVNAIHPFGERTLTKWPSHLPKISPDVSTILLSKDRNDLAGLLGLINDAA